VNVLKKYSKIIILAAAAAFLTAVPRGAAFAVNEGFNPRVMHEANKIITDYEAQILKNGPSVEAYEWIIKGLKIRKEAYFASGGASEIDEKITEKYKKIIEIDPSHYESLCELIAAEINKGAVEGQIEKLDGLVKNNPSRYEARLLRGRALFYSADFDGAIMDITKAVSMIPGKNNADAGYYKKLLETSNKHSAVIKKNAPKGLKEIIESSSAVEAVQLFELAGVFLDPEMVKCPANVKTGMDFLKKAIEKDPNYVEPYIKLGEALGEINCEYKEAMKVLSKVDNIAKEKSVLKRARLLRQKYYKLSMSKGKSKKK